MEPVPVVRNRIPAPAAVALVTALTALLTLLGGPVALAQPAPPIEINVYVVEPPEQNGGRPDTLRSIAQRTLGDPDRATEIFALNQGRRQPDGGALTTPDDPLRPGWLLRLPGDASGPDVRRGLLNEDAPAPAATAGGIRIPIVLALVAGLVLLQLTLAIVFRRRLSRGIRALSGAVAARWARLRAPARQRRELARNRTIAAPWRQDDRALAMASTVFAELAGVDRPPPALEIHPSAIAVRTAPGAALPAPWNEVEPTSWRRPLPIRDDVAGPPVARVGGTPDCQVVLDLSWCDGAVAVDGPPTVARALAVSVLAGLSRRAGMGFAVLGTLPAVTAPVRPLGNLGDLAALVQGHGASAPAGGPLRAGARRRPVHGVVVVGDDVDPGTAEAAAEICTRPGSTWVAIVLGNPVAAHWHWTVHPTGVVEITMLERDLVAAL
ncbi:hypothetical protein [Pseudonocardia zijingensis]|uniref:hypothetical protein n=1 Tax=Pseudonocardia zijingensis TaxID=153376 RepID=UPI0031D30FCB